MNIAIIRRNGLGDLLCAYPLILFLQQKMPEAAITLFVDQRNAPLIPYLPSVKEVVVLPATGNKYWNLYRTSRRYRKKFDLAISAKTSPMKLTNLFLYWLKAKERIAYVDQSWHARLINRPIPYDALKAKKMHQALKGLRTVAPDLEEIPQEFFPTLHIPHAVRERYPVEPPSQHPVLLVSATTTKAASRLDEDRYAALLNRLHRFTPISVRIVGQKNDQMRAEAISIRLQMPNQLYFPRTFDEFMVLVGTSDLFFVGDGGVAHIAAALGKKGVALFGETNPVEWRPLSTKVETLYHPLHVDSLSDQTIFEALKRLMTQEVYCG
jgi:ADP-heptose:LPS heptosyltransferase